jgi:hypothetical protein
MAILQPALEDFVNSLVRKRIYTDLPISLGRKN